MLPVSELFDSSALVVAHPDDELLWFSSILAHVRRGIICYEDCADLPHVGDGRRCVMQAYPLPTLSWLRKAEPCSLSHVDWQHPLTTPFGMALNAAPSDIASLDARPPAADAEARYENTFRELRAELQRELRGIRNVFTHNPWGEYGHPDHVQVSRVVESLQPDLGFRVWYSSYVSPRSLAFAAEFLPTLVSDLRLPTNAALVAEIKALYRRHDCWTWHNDYELFPDEAFLERREPNPAPGRAVLLNCVLP